MKLQFFPVTLHLQNTFRISRSTSNTRNNIIVNLYDNNLKLCGLGEIVSYDFFGQTLALATEKLALIETLLSKTSTIPEPALVENFCNELFLQADINHIACNHIKSGITAALLDLSCKTHNISVFDYLQQKLPALKVNFLNSSYTLGIDDEETLKKNLANVGSFNIIKVKLGSDISQAKQTIKLLRSLTTATLRVDPNCAWNLTTALEMSSFLSDYNVEYVEQPLPINSISDYHALYTKSPLPIFLDESIVEPNLLEEKVGMCHGINLKLSKCGGIFICLDMLQKALSLNLKVMVGCMIESGIGMAMAHHLSLFAHHADLDGNLLLSSDPAGSGGNFKIHNGKLIQSANLPGIGITNEKII